MNFNEYQKETDSTAIYPMADANLDQVRSRILPLLYASLGLCSEAGEVAGKVKKILRDDRGFTSDESVDKLRDELGDVQWYLARLAKHLDLTLEDVAQRNVEKLQSRKDRGVVSGDGDKR